MANKPSINTSVFIPMIRRAVPSMIANSIIGVQPMTGPAGHIFTIKNRLGQGKIVVLKNEDSTYAGRTDYGVQINSWAILSNDLMDMVQWSIDTFGQCVTYSENEIWFAREADRTLFLLRWSE